MEVFKQVRLSDLKAKVADTFVGFGPGGEKEIMKAAKKCLAEEVEKDDA